MRVSAKVDYAIRACAELAAVAGEGPVKGERIAQAQEIPLRFLENILLDLRHAGLVSSQRGAEGGYWLAKPPEAIVLADLIHLLPAEQLQRIDPTHLAFACPNLHEPSPHIDDVDLVAVAQYRNRTVFLIQLPPKIQRFGSNVCLRNNFRSISAATCGSILFTRAVSGLPRLESRSKSVVWAFSKAATRPFAISAAACGSILFISEASASPSLESRSTVICGFSKAAARRGAPRLGRRRTARRRDRGGQHHGHLGA